MENRGGCRVNRERPAHRESAHSRQCDRRHIPLDAARVLSTAGSFRFERRDAAIEVENDKFVSPVIRAQSSIVGSLGPRFDGVRTAWVRFVQERTNRTLRKQV
jgi:hypothetical protein